MPTVSDYIDPMNFERMISIVQTIAEFNVGTRKFNKPNLVLSLGQSLYKCPIALSMVQIGRKEFILLLFIV